MAYSAAKVVHFINEPVCVQIWRGKCLKKVSSVDDIIGCSFIQEKSSTFNYHIASYYSPEKRLVECAPWGTATY